LRVAEPGDPFGGGGEGDPLAGEAGAEPERDREMRLARPRRAEQDDVVLGGQEVELAEVEDERLLDRALEAEVELLERLAGGEAGGLDPGLAAVRVSRCDLGLKQRLGEALVAPLLGPGALGQLRQRPGRGRRLQRPEEEGELGGGGQAGIRAS
jgi:hypothetical protein